MPESVVSNAAGRYTCGVLKRVHLHLIIPVIITLLAWGLRIAALDSRALWFDEGVSITFSQMTLPDVVKYSVLWQDTNPPVYRVLLGVWTDAVGVIAWTARVFSALFGVLAIPLTYRFGRMLRLSVATSIMASLIVAIAPMQVYYSREVKHYTFVQAFVLIGIWVWIKVFHNIPRSTSGIAGLVSAAALTTVLAFGAHYIAALMPLTLGAWTIVRAATQRRHNQSWRRILIPAIGWGSSQIAAALLLLPWVLATAQGAAAGTRSASANVGLSTLPPATYLSQMLTEFAAGPAGDYPVRLVAELLILALAGLGFVSLRSSARWLLLSWIIVPLMAGMLIQVVMPFFYPRFLMFVTPAMALLAGQGLITLCGNTSIRVQALRLFPAITIIGALSAILITAQFYLPQPVPDLRPLANDLEHQLKPGDALVYSYSWQPGMLAAYLPDEPQPEYFASFFEPGQTGSSLEAILEDHQRVWLVTYTIGADDPINDVGLWLLGNAATPGAVWHGESQLSLFMHRDQAASADQPDECVTLREGLITLCFVPFAAQAASGEPVVITLEWQITEPITERYVVFVHLLAPDNPVPVAQQDSQPVNGLNPTFTWSPDSVVTDPHALVMPIVIDKQVTYPVVVGLYDADTLKRVPTDESGDSIRIGQITVMPTTR
jgi:hypothetical protein